MRRLGTLITAIALMLGVATARAQQQPPSLAEVARKEAERRKSVKTPAKVYTKADVKRGVPLTTAAATPAPPAQTPAAQQAGRQAAPAPKPAEEVQDEAWWRKRMTDLQEQLSRTRLFAEALQNRADGLWAEFTARDDPAQRAVIEANRNEALAELERVKGEIQRQQEAIADLEEEARKAGVPPGWLR